MSDSAAAQHDFTGLIAAAHTPFNAAGRLDANVIHQQYELFRESGVDGVFLGGTTGEGHSLSCAERRTVLDAWVGVSEGEYPVIAHIGHASVRDAVRLAKHAAKAGAWAIAAMAPIYYKPRTLEELVEYLAAIAAGAPDLPFYFYDAPDFTGVRFPTEQVLEWGRLRIPTLRGAKFTSTDLRTYARCLRLDPPFNVLVGYEETWMPAITLGARGAIGATINFAAPLYRRIYDAMSVGDLANAQAEHAKALELNVVLERFGVVRASKAIMALMGLNCGDVRLPLRPFHEAEMRELHELVCDMDVFARPLGTPDDLVR
jgi:N-acetylneuraminate lyase